MIFYFTGNGNSRWIAEQIAAYTHDKLFNIADVIKGKKTAPDISEEKRIGFIFPIYTWYAPHVVLNFARSLPIQPEMYCYAICTCGDDTGKGMQVFTKKVPLAAAWSIAMPNTYIPMFELDSAQKAQQKIKDATQCLPAIAETILNCGSAWNVHEGSFPRIKTYVLNPLFMRFMIHAEKFHVEGHCISCGICEKVCPVGNIKLQEGMPVWSDKCTHCMGCVHACPRHVIQYGKVTRKRGRYDLKELMPSDD